MNQSLKYLKPHIDKQHVGVRVKARESFYYLITPEKVELMKVGSSICLV
jgi:hypothetical protein